MKKNARKGAFLSGVPALMVCLAMLAAIVACDNVATETAKSDEKVISAFKIGEAAGAISDSEIAITVAAGTDVTSLEPEIELPKGAKVTPESGTAVDFSLPVTYLVTAENGSTKTYAVSVFAKAQSSEKNVTSFKIGDAVAAIYGDNSIYVVVPAGTNLSALTPDITVSADAAVSPASGEAANFTRPTTYTVTAQDGSTRNFVVTVRAEEEGKIALSVEFVQNGNDNIKVYGIPDGGIKLSRTGKNDAITISANNDLGDVAWFIDGQFYGNDNIITISANGYTLTQPHNITIVASRDGVNHSTAISFTVEK